MLFTELVALVVRPARSIIPQSCKTKNRDEFLVAVSRALFSLSRFHDYGRGEIPKGAHYRAIRFVRANLWNPSNTL